MRIRSITRVSVALIGFAALATIFASPASAHHRHHHRDYDYQYPPCHWY